MTAEFYAAYLSATLQKQLLLYVMNPNKFRACEYLIRLHEAKGDKVLVFSDNVFALKHYALALNKPFIYGGTTDQERIQFLHHFQTDSRMNCFGEDHQILTRDGFMFLADVRSHFETHSTLDIACYVAGRLEYHAITASELIVSEHSDHRTVRMESLDTVFEAGDQQRSRSTHISLSPTFNHRMFVRLGKTAAPRLIEFQNSVGPFDIRSAEEVLRSGTDPSVRVQFQAAFEAGFTPPSSDPLQLPFVAALGLTTVDQINAFLELYGTSLTLARLTWHIVGCFSTHRFLSVL